MFKMASNLVCRVHPVVLFGIIDSYERRNEDARRVIGTLLGTYDKGSVEVSNSFAVPHNESEDEVAVDIEYARNMYELHRKVNSSEVIVGWYSTSSEVSEHSVLIHEYYSRETKSPVHLTVGTNLKAGRLATKAYIRSPIGVRGKTTGSLFTPIQVEITCYDAERVGVELIQHGKDHHRRTVSMTSELCQVEAACGKLQEQLGIVLQYVDEVLSGKISADNQIGRHLMDLVNSVPQLDPEEFESMINSNMKDLLMVVYLANLTRTQLALNEKISTLS